MLDPEEIQTYMLNVFDKEQISVEVVFNSVDISVISNITQYTYDFTVIYYDVYQKYNVERHLQEIQKDIQAYKYIDSPCDIILSVRVG
jgi:starvation-inducible outer membrane lipoprotein